MKLFAWGKSDVGRKRDHNEDNFLVQSPLGPQVPVGTGLFAVADGMGGHQAGERASKMAIEIVAKEMGNGVELDGDGAAGKAIKAAAQRAGAAIFDAAQSNPELSGMGTTLTALLLHKGRGYLAHVGDSRCYLYRDGRCTQLTDDHSWVSEQVRAGLLSEEEARESKFKHIITRSVGFEREVQVDGNAVNIQPGDCFLLCSDGLSNYLDGDEIAKVLTAHFYKNVPSLLIELANDRGGEDNITVVLIHAANDAGT
jgi:serine/threonine protein phosphatase PrpC